MPLYVRDDTVDRLARELQAATGARNKTEAVRAALEAQLARVRAAPPAAATVPLRERLVPLKTKTRALGTGDATFDMKTFTDDLWGEG